MEKYLKSADYTIRVGNEVPYETAEDIKKIYIEKA